MNTMKEPVRYRRDRSLCPTIVCGESLTEQSHADECDINKILHDYTRTGFMRHAKEHAGRYDDVSAVDFQKSMETVANVKSMFECLPAQIRGEFNHDPAAFLTYVQEPANAKVLQDRGILVGNDGIDVTGAYTASPTKKTLTEQTDSGPSASEPETASQSTSDSASV